MANVFEKAIDVLRTRGWFQGDYVAPDGGAVCAVGALGVALTRDADHFGGYSTRADDLLARFVDVLDLDQYDSSDLVAVIAEWNDASGRSEEDVILALKGAAYCELDGGDK